MAAFLCVVKYASLYHSLSYSFFNPSTWYPNLDTLSKWLCSAWHTLRQNLFQKVIFLQSVRIKFQIRFQIFAQCVKLGSQLAFAVLLPTLTKSSSYHYFFDLTAGKNQFGNGFPSSRASTAGSVFHRISKTIQKTHSFELCWLPTEIFKVMKNLAGDFLQQHN